MSVTISTLRRSSVRLYLQLFVGGGGIIFIICVSLPTVVFLFCLSSFLLPVCLVCPFLFAPSVFSNVYFQQRRQTTITIRNNHD